MDQRAARARHFHREAAGHGRLAARDREQRDALVRELRDEDPKYWTYPRLASAVGCSVELIAHIVRYRKA